MSGSKDAAGARVNVRAMFLVVAATLVGVAGLVALAHGEGPGSRCDLRGGHLLVGPGGEIVCLSRANFLPLDEPADR